MKNKLLFNLLTPFATSNTEGKTFRNLLALVMVVLGMGFSWGQISISSSTAVTENFAIGTSTTASLPSHWKMSAAGAGSSSLSYSATGNLTAVTQGASSGSPSSGGRYNWGNGDTTSDRAIGFMTSGGYGSPNSIMAFYRNTSGVQINDIAIAFDFERYRINSTAASVTFFTSTNGTSWTARTSGDIASSSFATGSNAYNFTTGTVVNKSFSITGVNIANNGDFYLMWIVSTGSSNSQGIGLDNVSITATLNTGGSNSTTSDIITHSSFTEPTNIAYASTQENSNLTEGNSLEVAKFTLRDGGATNDTDSNSTTLNAITFTIANHTNLRRLALYDGSAELSEVAISAGTATFSSLTLAAGDNSTKDFSLRASFAGTVTDNSQFSFTVSSVTADIAGSTFAAANAGAAASSTIGDRNKIVVTADRLTFVQQTSNVALNTAMSPAPTVSANDALGNRDLDYVTDMIVTTTGTFGSATTTITTTAGLGTFNNLQFSALATGRTIAVTSGSLISSGNSNTFDIIIPSPGILLLEDNFTPTSSLLTSNSWSQVGTTATNPISTGINNGLGYTNYGSSNIGNAVILTTSGQDIYRTFASQNPGAGTITTYYSAIVSLSSVQATGDYFLTLGESSTFGGSSTLRARVFAKQGSTASKILFGISTDGTVTYATTEYNINTAILLAVKHVFTTSTSTSSLYINPSTTTEPTSADVTDSTASSVGTGLNAIVLRQGAAANTPTLLIDGLRVATNWGALLGNPQYSDNTTIAAGNYNSITTYDGSTPSISGNVNVYNQLSILGGTLTTNNTLTLKSNANGTAQVAAIGSGGTITGNVTVERFIPARRAYRFLSPAVTTSTTIRQNWQENGGTAAGLGTHITGTGGATNGFDPTETNNSSLLLFTNGAWVGATSTNVSLTAGNAYCLMVRGDRTTDLTTNTPATSNTVLRATGTLFTGNFSPVLSAAASGYSFIGNPYQAPLDIKTALQSSTDVNKNVVYYWDPTINARGGYITRNLQTSQNIPTSSVNDYVQPGQAFFVVNEPTLTSTPALTFTENHKSVANAAAGVFRNANTNEYGTLRVNLQANTNNQWTTIDGALAIFNDTFSWNVTSEDATKMANLDEEVSFVQNNTSLAIALQSNPSATSELPIKIGKMRHTNYKWKFELDNYDGATPYLFDTLNNSYTQINNGTVVPFTADANTTNRFKIVFQNAVLSNATFQNTLAIYPNPAKAGASFYVEGISEATVTVSNLLGQTVPVQTKSQGTTLQVTPNTSLSQGVYLVNITTQGTTQQVKWIVE